MRNSKSRFQNSIINLLSGFGYKILTLFTAFIVRTVFVRCLSAEYLGINGLYSSVLTMLSLAELGFGTAMVYSMYKPLANKDEVKLQQLMNLYKHVYRIIGTVILIIGLCIIPFLDYIIAEQPDVEGLTFYYILFLLNSVVSYWFFAYRNAILNADQKSYMITNYSCIFNLIKTILQIILIVVFHSYAIYLIVQILCTICQNIFVAYKVKKIYPFLTENSNERLPKDEKKRIFKDVKALMLSKIAHTVLNSTDNIIISAFVGLNWVGLLSNMVLISDSITSILCQITSSITASIGNFFAKESKNSGFKLFERVEFLNFWLYSFATIALIVLMNPFITLWLGEEYTMSWGVVITLGINFFVAGFMNTLWTFRSTLGLFTQGQIRPIIVAALNIVISIILSKFWGVAGVLAGTSISRACVNLWYDPWLIYRKGFGKSVKPFFVKYILRIVLLVVMTTVMIFIADRYVFVNGVTIFSFSIMTILTAVIPNLLFIIVFCKNDEFRFYLNFAKNIFSKLRK